MARGLSSSRVARTRRAAAVAISLCLASLALASCGGGGSSALGRQACREVSKSLALYNGARHDSSPAKAAHDASLAVDDLRNALAPAAIAATSDGQWQALEATLSESPRVPESDLVSALAAQCSLNESS